MAKVDILTFHWANYIGAVLQAYALYRVLESLEHESYIINYRPGLELAVSPVINLDKLVKKYGPLRLPLRKTIKPMLGEIVYYLPDISRETKKTLAFGSFREKYLKIKAEEECSEHKRVSTRML
ncbi:MAG: hypothetical protein QXW80_06755 [Candidatus Micrarchaeia archaeon]|uniref:hypothetical protein n=1 Tax=Saccharolobus sp. TaxID=2100761 RepID=UPI0031692A65